MNLKKEKKIKPLELWYSDPTKEHLGCPSIMYTYIQVNNQSKAKKKKNDVKHAPIMCPTKCECVSFHQSNITIYSLFFPEKK